MARGRLEGGAKVVGDRDGDDQGRREEAAGNTHRRQSLRKLAQATHNWQEVEAEAEAPSSHGLRAAEWVPVGRPAGQRSVW